MQVKQLELVLCLQQLPSGPPAKFAEQGLYALSRGLTAGSCLGKAQR